MTSPDPTSSHPARQRSASEDAGGRAFWAGAQAWWRALKPRRMAVDARERWRAGLGALLGLLFTGLCCRWLQEAGLGSWWMVAPLGASAVLVFAVPASPLAQPWSVVGGNTISALVGVACARWMGDPALAGAVAVGVAILSMFALRCLHPPGGAMALTAVLSHATALDFAWSAALLNSVLLVLAGMLFNTLTGRSYPHVPLPARAGAPVGGGRLRSDDLDAALARYNQVLDISREDLEALLRDAETASYRRRVGDLRCRSVMSPQVLAAEFGTSLREAWTLMRKHRVKALPVVDRGRHVIGIVTLADFMRHAGIRTHAGLARRLRALLTPTGASHGSKPEVVGQIMSQQVSVARADQHVVELVALFSAAGHHHLPVVDERGRLVGMMTQSDFVRAMCGVVENEPS